MMTHGEDEEHRKKTSLWEWEKLRRAYSMYEAVFPTSIGKYWYLVKSLVNKAYEHFFPPNIERGDEGEGVTDNGAVGEKVREALGKSLGMSKATMEDAAKSVANIAEETMHKAKEKVKRSFSDDSDTKRQNEL
ncbi:uncharacterized protein LOC133300404 isoform X2 [Gastrolobium bilobum]|uniref:uncharacterized protein LOC133300404 isoform X2 n=1 Tax=Gastrolobium bilobum TaxID=150636 RepID=UPI002AB2A918|nr:uncharacterized protein LOC133300404 isoform X2 [Gastrolobium bilobum]